MLEVYIATLGGKRLLEVLHRASWHGESHLRLALPRTIFARKQNARSPYWLNSRVRRFLMRSSEFQRIQLKDTSPDV